MKTALESYPTNAGAYTVSCCVSLVDAARHYAECRALDVSVADNARKLMQYWMRRLLSLGGTETDVMRLVILGCGEQLAAGVTRGEP